MIRVLVLANESVLASFLVSTLAYESEFEVFRVTRDELGSRRDFSIVIVVDEETDEQESIKLREVFRGEDSLLVMRVSLISSDVVVDESFQLVNPGIAQMMYILKEFSKRDQIQKIAKIEESQKKMNRVVPVHANEYNWPQTDSSFVHPGVPSREKTPMSPLNFFIHFLGLKNTKNVTVPTWQEYVTGNNK